MTSRITIIGKITRVEKTQSSGSQEKRTILHVRNLKTDVRYRVMYDGFCIARDADLIYASCRYDPKQDLSVPIRPPFISVATDRETIVKTFKFKTKISFHTANKSYDDLLETHLTEQGVVDFISSLAESYNDSLNEDLVDQLPHALVDKGPILLTWWYKNVNLRKLYLFGLTRTEINSSNLTCYGLYQQIIVNPYRVACIPMEKADSLVERLNKKPHPDDRQAGLIVRHIWKFMQNGSSVVPLTSLRRTYPMVDQLLSKLLREYDLIVHMEYAYLKPVYETEQKLLAFVKKLRSADPIEYDTPIGVPIFLPLKSDSEDPTEKDVVSIKREPAVFSDDLSEEQKRAVQGAMDQKLTIITGPAGTGKSTCLKQLALNLTLLNRAYALCSFTGKAVYRIVQVTGKSAFTIHRLIKMAKKDLAFRKTLTHIIIDEASMVTTALFMELLTLFPLVTHVTLVGDPNQLPPIGWGEMFKQLILSETVPVYRLSVNFRVYVQDLGDLEEDKDVGDVGEDKDFGEDVRKRDGIILNSNNIIRFDPASKMTFGFQSTDNFQIAYDETYDSVLQIVYAFKENGYPSTSLTIVTPHVEDVTYLNIEYQRIYLPDAEHVYDYKARKWAVGDRVMNIRNDYRANIFNGEEGRIVSVDEGEGVIVDFGTEKLPRKVEFKLKPEDPTLISAEEDEVEPLTDDDPRERTINNLIHAYALTVHKAQGSECDFIIFFAPRACGHGSFICKNLIYTGLTRAKRCLYLCGYITQCEVAAVKPMAVRYDNVAPQLASQLAHVEPTPILTEDRAYTVIDDQQTAVYLRQRNQVKEAQTTVYPDYYGDEDLSYLLDTPEDD